MRVISVFILIVVVSLLTSELSGQTERISYRGYTDCYRISNDSVEVIIVAEAGARVLNYSLHGKNMMYENPDLDGKRIEDWFKRSFQPDGARFDIRGAANPTNKRDTLWIGPYTAEITGKYSVKTTSMVDTDMGIDITREFFLDSITSHLLIRHTMTNKSNSETNWYFWNRIFSPIGGKIIIPLNPNSKFNSKWGYYSGTNLISENAYDPNVDTSDSLYFLRAELTGENRRYAIDSDQGWIVYGYNEQLYLLTFDVDLTKTYLTDSGETIIIFTNGESLVELEPTSPVKKLNPGESYTFEENWWLFSYPEAHTKDFDGAAAATFALANAHESGKTVDIRKGINNNESMSDVFDLSIFPNPAGDHITVSGKRISSAELYTTTGRMLYGEKFTGANEDFLINTGSIPKGVYFLKVFFDENQAFAIRKVVIVNG